MAENIGSAQIAFTVALEDLRKQMKQAQNEVEQIINQTKKDITLNVNTNVKGQLDTQLSKITDSFKSAQKEVEILGDTSKDTINKMTDFSRVGNVVKEVSDKYLGLGTTSATALGEVTSATTTMVGGLSAAGPVLFTVALAAAELAAAIAAVVKFTGDVIDKVKLYIGQNEDLSDAIESVKNTAKELWQGLVDIYDALVDKVANGIVAAIKGFKATWDEMNRVTGSGDNLLSSLRNLMKVGFEAVMRVVDSVIKIFSSFSGQSDTSKEKVQQLSGVLNAMAGIFNAVAFVVSNVAKGISMVADAASFAIGKLTPVLDVLKDIVNTVMKMPAGIFGGVFDSTGQSKNNNAYGPDAGNFKNSDEEYSPGNQEGKNKFNQYVPPKSKGGSSSTSGKKEEVDLVQLEKEALDDVIKAREQELDIIEKKLKLGEADIQQRSDLLKTMIAEIEDKKSSLTFSENIQSAENKILDLRVRQKQTIDEINKAHEESHKKLIDNAGKDAENIKQSLSANVEAINKIKVLKLQYEGDELKLALFNIEEKYRKEIQSINNSKVAEEIKIKYIKQLELNKTKELETIHTSSNEKILQFMKSGFATVTMAIGQGFSNMWTKVFGEANSLFEILMKSIYQQLIDLAASAIFKYIIKVLSGGSSGFLSFLFGEGGYTGDGAEDEPAGIVHKKEFVVSAAGTSIPANRDLLEAMNRGEDVASLIGRTERSYASSESIRSGAIAQISSTEIASADRSVNINIDGLNVNTKIQKLTGLNENDWIDIVDNEIIPQVSKGLKRAGKEVLDSTIN